MSLTLSKRALLKPSLSWHTIVPTTGHSNSISLYLGLKKTCLFPIPYRPCSITCYSKVFLGVCITLTCFLFRMYFYKSIFILNGATTYLIWHALFKFSHIAPFTQKSKIKKNKIKHCPTYPETEE